MDGFDGGALNGPHAVIVLNDTWAATRRQKQAKAFGKRRDIFAAHPTRDAGGLGTKERFAEDYLDGLDARRIEGLVALQVAQLRCNVDDIARGRTVAKVDQDRGPDLRLIGEGLQNAVGKRLGQRTGGNVEDHAREGGNGLWRRLRFGLLGRAGMLHGSLLRFGRTKQRQLLGHGPCTSHPIRLQKQEPRSG